MTHDLSTTLRSTRIMDRYIDDAARIFAESGVAGFFPDLEGFPDDHAASAADPEAYRKFLADNAV